MAAAAAPPYPEPLARALAALCTLRNASDADAERAFEQLREFSTSHPDGLHLALAACNEYGAALLAHKTKQLPLPSLAAVVREYADKAKPASALAAALTSSATPSYRASHLGGFSMFSVAPAQLGRYVSVGRCKRYLHLRTERHHGERYTALQVSVDPALEASSRSAAVLAKGLVWETELNAALEQGSAAFSSKLLPVGGTWGSPTKFVNVMEEAMDKCNCVQLLTEKLQTDGMNDELQARLSAAIALGRKVRDDDGHERRHETDCDYRAALRAKSLDLLHNAQPGTCIYQASIKFPEELRAREAGQIAACCTPSASAQDLDAAVIAMAECKPDYVFVCQSAGGVRQLVVVDAKHSKSTKASHKAQVSYYVLLLRHILGENQVAQHGGVWRPRPWDAERGAPLDTALDIFPIQPLVEDIYELLYVTVPKYLTREAFDAALAGRGGAAPEKRSLCAGQEWRLRPECRGCDFLSGCRTEALQVRPTPLQTLPGMTPTAERALQALTENEVLDVESLTRWLTNDSAKLETRAALTVTQRRTLSGVLSIPLKEDGRSFDTSAQQRGDCISAALAARSLHRAIPRRGALSCTLPAPPADGKPYWGVYVTLLADPQLDELYAWAIQALLIRADPKHHSAPNAQALPPAAAVAEKSQFYSMHEAASEDASRHVLPRPHLAKAFIEQLHYTLCTPRLRGQRVCLFVLESSEQQLLLRTLVTATNADDPEQRSMAQELLFAVLDGRLLNAEEISRPDDIGQHRMKQLLEADKPHMCVLYAEISRLLELPCLGFVTPAEVARHVVPHGAGSNPQTVPDHASALAFLLGPTAELANLGGSAHENLVAAAEACDGDAVFRDWSLETLLGTTRVVELVARRLRFASLMHSGLLRLLDAAGGVDKFAPLEAALCPEGYDAAPFASPSLARLSLFKWLEQRHAALKMRKERSAQLEQRLVKGKTLLARIEYSEPPEKKDGYSIVVLTCTCEGLTDQSVRDACCDDPGLEKWLVCPNKPECIASSLRFPDSALCEHSGDIRNRDGTVAKSSDWKTKLPNQKSLDQLWRCDDDECFTALVQSLTLGASFFEWPDSWKIDADKARLKQQNKFKVVVPLSILQFGKQPHFYTALREADLQPDSEILLFERLFDQNSAKVAARASSSDAAADNWQSHIRPGREVTFLLDETSGDVAIGMVTAVFDTTSMDGEAVQVDDSNYRLFTPTDVDIIVTATLSGSPADCHSALRVPLSRVQYCSSLFRTLVEEDAREPEFPGAAGGLRSRAARWGCGRPFLADRMAALNTAFGKFNPTASQKTVFEHLVTHRLTSVWGPPGTGKSFWLSRACIAMMQVASSAPALPFRILVTAVTKVAISNIMKKIADSGLDLSSTCEVIDMTHGERIGDLWARERCIVGATIWKAATSLSNSGKPFPKFDVLICDEGSQMLMSDALLAVELVNPLSGRVCVVGDHLQLPPLIHGAYDDDEAASASFLHAVRGCLMREDEGSCAREHVDACKLLDCHRLCETLAAFQRNPVGLYPAEYKLCDAPGSDCPCRDAEGRKHVDGGGSAQLDIQRLPGQPTWVIDAIRPEAKLVAIKLPGNRDDEEADVACKLLLALHRSWSGEQSKFAKEVRVVAPHHRQIDALKSKLAAESNVPELCSDEFKIQTVEKAQGQEADVVLVLYALSDPAAIAAEYEFLYNAERLTVALTRARFKTIVLLTEAVMNPDEPSASTSGRSAESAQRGAAELRRLIVTCSQSGESSDEPFKGARLILAADADATGRAMDVDN